jgi:hypothetical protein
MYYQDGLAFFRHSCPDDPPRAPGSSSTKATGRPRPDRPSRKRPSPSVHHASVPKPHVLAPSEPDTMRQAREPGAGDLGGMPSFPESDPNHLDSYLFYSDGEGEAPEPPQQTAYLGSESRDGGASGATESLEAPRRSRVLEMADQELSWACPPGQHEQLSRSGSRGTTATISVSDDTGMAEPLTAASLPGREEFEVKSSLSGLNGPSREDRRSLSVPLLVIPHMNDFVRPAQVSGRVSACCAPSTPNIKAIRSKTIRSA